MMDTLVQIAGTTLRVSTPLLFAALGGLWSERSGVINIALEGLMLIGAFAAAAVAMSTHSPWVGAVGGMGAGVALAALYGVFVIRLRANQIVAGTAINMLAAGITPFLCKVIYGSTTATPALPTEERFHIAPIWGAWILLAVVAWTLRVTPFGLRVRFAGEHPEALDAAGVRVNRIRWVSVLLSGALCGLGGMSLSIFFASSFSRNMTAGRGF
ncbi:MAG: ABC transporter permease, partial [Bdellovibrionota bacterium]